MALGVLAIVILIVMVAPIVIFLKREDYKNLASQSAFLSTLTLLS